MTKDVLEAIRRQCLVREGYVLVSDSVNGRPRDSPRVLRGVT